MITIITLAIAFGMLLGAYSTRLRPGKNKDRAWNESRWYVTMNNPFNYPPNHVFTQHDVNEAKVRADKQPEDRVGASFVASLTIIFAWMVLIATVFIFAGCATGPRVIDLTNQPRHAPAQTSKAKSETPRKAEAHLTHDFTR